MKLWTGRFSKEPDSKVNDFNSSIRFDSRMIHQDIQGSMAHASMLGKCGIIGQEEADLLVAGLEGIERDLQTGALSIDPNAEDVHTFIEGVLTERLGNTGKRLHTARSRNDQVALDVRLYLRDEAEDIQKLTATLIQTLIKLAKANLTTVMPGYTHMQRAQPITFAHHLMAYVWMLLRDLGRLTDAARRMNLCPLGSGALAGTTYPIDRSMTASALAFDGAVPNSLDGVADRDFCVELASALALEMTHLSRLSEEIVLWCSWEFKFIELDDAWATGSSIMPQKKNPDVAELIRGKTGRVNGDLVALLTMLKGLPLAYNKDMQEDKEAIFDAFDTVRLCLTACEPMLATMTVLPENMRAAAAKGFINATDCADYLVKKGLPFRDAYKAVGQLVALCISKQQTLETLPLAEYQAVCELFAEDVYEAISLEVCVEGRNCLGGPGSKAVKEQIAQAESVLCQFGF